MRVSLNCYPPSVMTGLGTMARTLYKLLPFNRQLLSHQHPRFDVPGLWPSSGPSLTGIHKALEDVDCMVSLERPLPGVLFREARALGKRTVMVVMHEWLNPGCEWLPHVDLFLSPNDHCTDKLRKMGLGGRSAQVNLPLYLDGLPFTQRTRAGQFVFSNGWGGVNDRKGWPEMREALKVMTLEERGRFRVTSQVVLTARGVDAVPAVHYQSPSLPSSQEVYEGMDVAVVPSRCEGLGYSMLEPMAIGLPVLATDAEPMSQYLREAYGAMAELCLLPVTRRSTMMVWNHPVEYALCDPAGIVRTIRRFKELPTSLVMEISDRGRSFVMDRMGQVAANNLWRVISDGNQTA